MCGFEAVFAEKSGIDVDFLRLHALDRLGHRGPDGLGAASLGRATVAHTRLAIVDPASGRQPMHAEDGAALLVCNGEIYNHRALRERLAARHRFATGSDSEVVVHLYEELGAGCVDELDGMFAFFATDGASWVAARDPFGIKPLYYGTDTAGRTWLGSELKSIAEQCADAASLPPGSSIGPDGKVERWFDPAWRRTVGSRPDGHPEDLAERLERAVVKRLMSDVPLGVFLSGGLDSSIVAAIVRRHLPGLKTFSVGLEGAPDLEAAREAAHALDTDHYERVYTPREAEEALERVVYHLESYDAALIQSAVPCYFLSELAAQHVKVVLTGEGADEVFGGYGYFAGVEDPRTVHDECARLLLGLHSMNLQRVDRMTMAHGLEARVPFLDVELVAWGMELDPRLKLHGNGRAEKHLLRRAFEGQLPPAVLHRKKAEFSRGAGAEDVLAAVAERRVSARDLAQAAARFPDDTPTDEQAFLYRSIFERLFPSPAARRTVGGWRGAWVH